MMALRYLEQMRELGESEISLSDDVRQRMTARPSRESQGGEDAPEAVQRADGGRIDRPRSSAPERAPSGGARGTSTKAAGSQPQAPSPKSVADTAADLPEPEVVAAELAVGGGPGTGDMFSERSRLEDCTSLGDVEEVASTCEKCELARGRNNVVFGVGNPAATLMFVGEAPGRDEDLQGVPFVGRAGQLLNKILDAVELARDDVYIGNIIKCRPPNNRTPLTTEIDACMPYLAKQICCIKPSVICTLGLPATHTLLGLRGSMGSLRGKIYRAKDISVVPTYHPAAALRDPRYKKPIWEDFLILRREYDRAEGKR